MAAVILLLGTTAVFWRELLGRFCCAILVVGCFLNIVFVFLLVLVLFLPFFLGPAEYWLVNDLRSVLESSILNSTCPGTEGAIAQTLAQDLVQRSFLTTAADLLAASIFGACATMTNFDYGIEIGLSLAACALAGVALIGVIFSECIACSFEKKEATSPPEV